jgi:hypothetical protein
MKYDDGTVSHYMLRAALKAAVEYDTDYDKRYGTVIMAAYWAFQNGLKVGFRIDPAEPEWPVVYIVLPTGQISWHMPQIDEEWDGHSTEEKHRRINEYLDAS